MTVNGHKSYVPCLPLFQASGPSGSLALVIAKLLHQALQIEIGNIKELQKLKSDYETSASLLKVN